MEIVRQVNDPERPYSQILRYRAVLTQNREVFLINHRQELGVVEDTDQRVQNILEIICKKRTIQGKSLVYWARFL